MTAANLKIADLEYGDRFRITDPNHPMAGRTGTLEFKHVPGGNVFIMIDGRLHKVDLAGLQLMPRLKVVA